MTYVTAKTNYFGGCKDVKVFWLLHRRWNCRQAY